MRPVRTLLVALLFVLTSADASAMEEESAMPKVPLALSYQANGQTKVANLQIDPAQVVSALKKKNATTFSKLASADPAALGVALASQVSGVSSSTGGALAQLLITGAQRSIQDRNAGKTIQIIDLDGASGPLLQSLSADFGRASTVLGVGHASVLLNPSRTYRAS